MGRSSAVLEPSGAAVTPKPLWSRGASAGAAALMRKDVRAGSRRRHKARQRKRGSHDT
jgi:hypothetical protein